MIIDRGISVRITRKLIISKRRQVGITIEQKKKDYLKRTASILGVAVALLGRPCAYSETDPDRYDAEMQEFSQKQILSESGELLLDEELIPGQTIDDFIEDRNHTDHKYADDIIDIADLINQVDPVDPADTVDPVIAPSQVFRTLGNISLVGGYVRQEFEDPYEDVPLSLIASLGYNLLDRTRQEGTIIFPNIRAIASLNSQKYDWGNKGELALGAIAQIIPFQAGIEGGYRIGFFDDYSEAFFRAWLNYWGSWQGESITGSKRFPLMPWGTQYAEARYESASDSLVFDARADINIDILRLFSTDDSIDYTYPGLLAFNGATLTPFAAFTLNMDVQNAPWNRWIRGSGGIKLIEGEYNVISEIGYRHSLNGDFYQGLEGKIELRVWLPLDFGNHEVIRNQL